MAKTKMKRWVCPLCGSGKLAPSRPRKDDTRRFCLPCSEKTGRLVERTCPALDKERSVKETMRKAKKAVKAVKAEQAHRAKVSYLGFNFETLAEIMWRIPSNKRRTWDVPEVTVSRYTVAPRIQGRGWYNGSRVKVNVLNPSERGYHRLTPTARTHHLASSISTLLHEMVHAMGVRHHGRDFAETMAVVMDEAWDFPGAYLVDPGSRAAWRTLEDRFIAWLADKLTSPSTLAPQHKHLVTALKHGVPETAKTPKPVKSDTPHPKNPTGRKSMDEVASHPGVDSIEYKGYGGYWVYLKDGWISTDTDCQTIHELTTRDVKQAMQYVVKEDG